MIRVGSSASVAPWSERLQGLRWLPVILFLAACRHEPPLPARPGTPVTLYRVVAPEAPGDARYSANVEAYSLVRVSAEVAGTIRSIRQVQGAAGERDLQAGDRVADGDVLAKIDDSPYQQQLDAAQATLEGNEARMIGAKDNYERHVAAGDGVSASQLESALTRYESEKAAVARSKNTVGLAELQVSWCTVKAPQAGLVLKRQVEVGDLVAAGTPLFQIGDTRRMKVVFGVPPDLATHIEVGIPLKLVVGALEDRQYEGPVTQVSPSADPKSRVFDVEVTVENPDGELRVGMIASLRLPASVTEETKPLVTVPLDAVVRPPSKAGAYAVYVPDPAIEEGSAGTSGSKHVARLREIVPGRVREDEVEIQSGLSVGDSVIVRGSTIVQDGTAIRIIP